MMHTIKFAALLVVCSMVGVCHAQKANPLVPMAKSASVAAQTSSPKNYVLLQPIASKRKNKAENGLLSPIHRTAAIESVSVETMALETAATSTISESSIVVTPMKFKRGIFDEHQFKVENTSDKTLKLATILLKAPVGSVVQQVSPKPDSVDGTNIALTVHQIAPGDYTVVDVAINYPRDVFAIFESNVMTEHWGDSTIVQVAKSDAVASTNSRLATEVMPTSPMGNARAQSSTMLSRTLPAMTVSATTNRTVEERIVEEPIAGTLGVDDQNAEYEIPTTSVVEELVNESVVKSYLHGPGEVRVGEVVDYSVDIQNLSADKTGEIIVQLSIPQTLKVTLLDRDAWYDGDSRKITWQLDNVKARAIETIRYKAVIKQAGPSEQMIVVGMGDRMESTSSLKTIAK